MVTVNAMVAVANVEVAAIDLAGVEVVTAAVVMEVVVKVVGKEPSFYQVLSTDHKIL